MRWRRSSGDAGAAVAEFAMVSVLLVFLFMAVLQVAVYFYARTVVAASVADAARYAAAAGIDPADGAARARTLVSRGLDASDARAIRCSSHLGRDGATGLAVTTVRCAGRIRLLFLPIGVPLTVDESSSVLREEPP
jgi:Flp pilus assembly protein TadG